MRILILFLAMISAQSVLADARLPMISADQMKVGNSWTWTYYTQGDLKQPYSSEHYQVVDADGTQITLEMSSRYGGVGEFAPTHRFRVDLKKCFRAFQNPQLKQAFLIDLYPYENGQLSKTPIPTAATAFEEKFNCNPWVHTGTSLYETRYETDSTPWGSERVFQQWPKIPRVQLRAFYFMDKPGLQGIAYRKDFNPGTSSFYEMMLVDWSVQ